MKCHDCNENLAFVNTNEDNGLIGHWICIKCEISNSHLEPTANHYVYLNHEYETLTYKEKFTLGVVKD